MIKQRLLGISLTFFILNTGAGARAESVNSVVQQSVANPNTINAGNYGDQGREGKAAAAQNTANDGQAAAVGTGLLLLSAGIPMSQSLLIPVKVAGYDLIAKAGQEFAQAAADNSAANQNGAQKSLLTSGDAQQTDNLSAPNYLTPDDQALLQNSGINPATFGTALSNGQLTDPSSVAQALGGTTAVSPAVQAQASQLVATTLNDLSGNSSSNPPLIPVENASGALASDASGGSATSANANSGLSNLNQNLNSDPTVAAAATSGAANSPTRKVATASGSTSSNNSSSDLTPDESTLTNFLNGALGPAITVGVEAALQNPIAKEFLKDLGIQRTKPTENIFQVAHRNFHGKKWLKQTKVALR
jgi:hypothetical protein